MTSVGPISRFPRNEKKYMAHRQDMQGNGCDFCDLLIDPKDQVIAETEHCLVIINLFGYDIWDGCSVDDHIMVIPKRHVTSISELGEEEKSDYMNIMVQYEAEGYSIYARAPSDKNKSVAHQHMHFIKVGEQKKNWLIYTRRPHILLSK